MQVAKLQDQADTLTRKIEIERRRVAEMDRQIAEVEGRIAEQRKKMGGVNASKEATQQIQRQIKMLENRLEKAYVKYNEAMAHNRDLKEQIDSLRKERLVFDSVYKKLEKELSDKKAEMEAVRVLPRPLALLLLLLLPACPWVGPRLAAPLLLLLLLRSSSAPVLLRRPGRRSSRRWPPSRPRRTGSRHPSSSSGGSWGRRSSRTGGTRSSCGGGRCPTGTRSKAPSEARGVPAASLARVWTEAVRRTRPRRTRCSRAS